MSDVTYLNRSKLVDVLQRQGASADDVSDALALAESVRGAQRRAGGGPYLEEHVYPVTAAVAAYLALVAPAEVKPAALTAILHDTIEDSTTVTEETIASRFGSIVADAVATLTKPAKRGGGSAEMNAADEQRYVSRIADSERWVRVIKVFDRLNNLASVQQRPPEQRRNYLCETNDYYLDLARATDETLARQMEDLLRAQSARAEGEAAT